MNTILDLTTKTSAPTPDRDDLLMSCVHCGFCLEVCPTYQLSGDENNSPRGRLRLWREEKQGKIAPDGWTDFYTSECVGCLACESACPSNVPYGRILEQTRHAHMEQRRSKPKLELQAAAMAVGYPKAFDLFLMPARALRAMGILPHPLVFPGQPSVLQSTEAYARELMGRYRPTGPRVALLTGCLMEALFREINFATVRVLIENNVQVIIPKDQGCCGAFQEHIGLDGVEDLRDKNRKAFQQLDVDCAVSNSAGCGLSLKKTLEGGLPVKDVLLFLGEIGVKPRRDRGENTRVYVDLPCHLVHGQRAAGIPANVLDASGYRWELAPCAKDCCGSGGIYNIQKPENAQRILRTKSAFLNAIPDGISPILATANHVCMMQWNSARWNRMVVRPFQVRHVIQLLDPGCEQAQEL